jgi:hypothetical protein
MVVKDTGEVKSVVVHMCGRSEGALSLVRAVKKAIVLIEERNKTLGYREIGKMCFCSYVV